MKILLLILFSVCLLGVSAVRPLPQRFRNPFLKNWQHFFEKESAEKARLAKNIELENQWNEAFPKLVVKLSISDPKYVADSVYQLNCEYMASGSVPSEYKVHFYAQGESLGFYDVNASKNATTFTANQETILSRKHQILEVEGHPRPPFILLIKPAFAEAYQCRVEFPSDKHPQHAFSNFISHIA